MCVCMYIRLYVHIKHRYIRMHSCIHISIRTYVCAYMAERISIRVLECACMFDIHSDVHIPSQLASIYKLSTLCNKIQTFTHDRTTDILPFACEQYQEREQLLGSSSWESLSNARARNAQVRLQPHTSNTQKFGLM